MAGLVAKKAGQLVINQDQLKANLIKLNASLAREAFFLYCSLINVIDQTMA